MFVRIVSGATVKCSVYLLNIYISFAIHICRIISPSFTSFSLPTRKALTLTAIDLLTERPDDEMSFFFVVAVLKLQDVKILKQTERASRLRMKRAR